jgi:hypothetical protein
VTARRDPVDGDARRISPTNPSASYLLARLARIEARVRLLVASRRRDDPAPDDPFKGLYLSDEHIDLILAASSGGSPHAWDESDELSELEAEITHLQQQGTTVRLRELSDRAGLDGLDVDLLLVALAPDLDARFEKLYGYLNDDVTRRRATVALALELAGASPWSAAARARLSPDGQLVAQGLVYIDESDRPFLSRSLRVPDRVASHVLGGDAPDPAIAGLLATPAPGSQSPLAGQLAAVVGDGVDFIYLRERAGSSAPSLAAEAMSRSGLEAVILDLSHLGPNDEIADVVRLAWREALLIHAGVVAGPIDPLAQRDASAVRTVAGAGQAGISFRHGAVRSAAGVPLILYGRIGWEPGWSHRVPLTAEVDPDSAADRREIWWSHLGEERPDSEPEAGLQELDRPDVTGQFVLSADQVARAVEAARLQARLDGKPIDVEHLRFGARAQNSAGLERLARRIRPTVTWDDLVLAGPTEEALRNLAARARRRSMVLDEWGMRPGGGRGRGITALFAGDSGTGKTMSAEVVAGDLGLDLYTVNLATVVDKYVGETEKNLERIFSEADGVNAVLLFDEADAIFGKRSEVRDANDRYANIEVAYLLQRMETFDGIAILATNLRANVDEAFTRRLDLIVDFPTPDVPLRRALWDRCLAPGVPRAVDLDLDFCARSFELSGGNIRSVAITAAYLAADGGREVTMRDLIRAIQQEYRKLGRLVVPGEFGPYFALL